MLPTLALLVMTTSPPVSAALDTTLTAPASAGVCRAVTPVPVRWHLTSAAPAADNSSKSAPVAAPPVPASLEKRVALWARIWGELESRQWLLVEQSKPWIVHAEVDCRTLKASACTKRRDAARGEMKAKQLVWLEGKKDGLLRALAVGDEMLGAAEAMFDLIRVPREYARLAVVESMMRTDAVSSAGATGAYQFMPETAARYLAVKDGVDERRDPVRSSLAAAKYLKLMKAQLGSWPHALTAYNTGPARVRASMKRLRTKDIGKIVDESNVDGFGFASRNYAAQVLAVARVTSDVQFMRPVSSDLVVRLDKKLSFEELASCVNVDAAELARANPSLTSTIVDGKKPAPKGYLALVPRKPRLVSAF